MDKPPSSDTSYGPGRDLHVVQVVGAEDDLIPFDNDVLGESSYCEMLCASHDGNPGSVRR